MQKNTKRTFLTSFKPFAEDIVEENRDVSLDRQVFFGPQPEIPDKAPRRGYTSFMHTADPREGLIDTFGRQIHNPGDERIPQVRVLKASDKTSKLTFADFEDYRVCVAWRIVRETMRHWGAIEDDQTLLEATVTDNHDYWSQPLSNWTPSKAKAFSYTKPYKAVLAALTNVHALETEHQRWSIVETTAIDDKGKIESIKSHAFTHGHALLPPPPPYHAHDIENEGRIRDEYDPDDDPGLRAYIDVVQSIARSLYIYGGSRVHPDLGMHGMHGMDDAWTVRVVHPTPNEIIAFETFILDKTMEMITRNSQNYARNFISDTFGLLDHEMDQVVKMARARARSLTDASVDDKRAIMELRLEDAIARARDALDIRSELTGLKHLSVVQGLGRAETMDASVEFFQVVKQIGQEDRGEMPALPEPVDDENK